MAFFPVVPKAERPRLGKWQLTNCNSGYVHTYPTAAYPCWTIQVQHGGFYEYEDATWYREGGQACPTQSRILSAVMHERILWRASDHLRARVNAKGGDHKTPICQMPGLLVSLGLLPASRA